MDSPVVIISALIASAVTGVSLQHVRPGPVAVPGGRRRLLHNIGMGFIVFAVAGATGGLLIGPAELAADRGWRLLARLGAPVAVSAVVGVLALETSYYWLHRLEHRSAFLWRIHRVHHTDPGMDVTTALRSHPVDLIVSNLVLGATAFAVGIPPLVVAGYNLATLVATFLQHANVQLPARLDQTLSTALMTPSLHRMHHSARRSETDSNFGGVLVLTDTWFGSRTEPSVPEALGLDLADLADRQTVGAMLVDPLRNPARDREVGRVGQVATAAAGPVAAGR